MENVTDQTSNPFGMRPPCDRDADVAQRAVFGYGDANADFHVIGDHPGVHGGARTGVPFTETESGRAIARALFELGFASGPETQPTFENLFCTYLHMCVLPDGHEPTPAQYADLEPYFDAELRAINAHILVPVGERATDHVLREYTTRRRRLTLDMAALHTTEVRGRGFLVLPVREPREWESEEPAELVAALEAIRSRDYRQTKGVATLVG